MCLNGCHTLAMTIATTAKRPGRLLIRYGAGLVLIAGILIAAAFTSTTTSVVPGTFQTVTVQDAPNALTWAALAVGALLLTAGIVRRVLRR